LINVLDYGCGNGEFASYLVKKAKKIYACDVDIDKISKAQNNYGDINFSKIKVGAKLPYKNNFFDAVFMFHVLEHVESEKRVIKEVFRVLKKGGKLYLASPYKGLFYWADMANLRFVLPRAHKMFIEFFLGKAEYRKCFIDKRQIGLFGDSSITCRWHRHYKEYEIRKMLFKNYDIELFYKFSFFHPFLLLIGNVWDYLFGFKSKLINRIIWFDNKISAGNFSYNMLVVARKK
jgi:2-polyprenyl-3-methyl-5-hydroxy-6-metoxy-1,4-benzoquinol methylase